MDFSRIVKQRMAELSVTNSELARRSGYSPQYISDLLSGDKRWNETTMNKVCEALGIEVRFCISDEQAATSELSA